ncbi:MAG: UvrB/UvrC motif-containing protein, partial [Planctomycetota bacterium]|nr:UvrB/UvrC motif-containing protein [Planctomycetota bacterium]
MDHDALMEKIRALPKTPGVYLMKDALGRVIYVGKALSLRSRVGQYFQPSADLGIRKEQMLAEIADVEFLPAESEVDALLQEARLIKDVHPKYNVRLTDDKTFPYLEITAREQFPGVYFTRTPAAKGTRLFGPFTHAAGLKLAINELQRIFRFRTCNLDIREEDPNRKYFRPCILYAIDRCTAPCAGHIERAAYRKSIARLARFVEGDRRQVVRDLMREMKSLAKELKFEEAARVRDQLRAIESLAQRGRVEEHLQPEVFAPSFDPTEGLTALARRLGSAKPIRSIEGVDIANLGEREAVGALVMFLDGRPFKPGYRRFRIKTVAGQNDFAMIGEVVYRRLRRLTDELSIQPDLVLVDGGLGQLHAAAAAIAEAGGERPLLVSLAKRDEEVYVLGMAEKEPLRLARTDPGLKLLQAVRDEAHRFAQHYHHLLRRKALFGEKTARELRKVRRTRKGARG